MLQTVALKQQIYCLAVLEAVKSGARVRAGPRSLWRHQGIFCLVSLWASDGCWQSLTFLDFCYITRIPAVIFTQHSPCAFWVEIPPFCKDTGHIGSGGQHYSSLTLIYLNTSATTLFFPMKSHSEVLGVRIQHMNVEDAIQHITALNEKLEVQGSVGNFSVLSIFLNPTRSIEPSSSPRSFSAETFPLHLMTLLWARVLFTRF